MFTALHNFRPEEVRAILADAAASHQGFGAFELSERSVRGLLLILTPFIRPFRWTRLAWTCLVPVVPMVVLFDGAVSALRSYTVDELRGIVDSLDRTDYTWEVGALRGKAPIPVAYLLGCPVASASSQRPDGSDRQPEPSALA